jgi:hypothetical protein
MLTVAFVLYFELPALFVVAVTLRNLLFGDVV